jgi:beta-carotene 3-hydroxylase
MILNLVILLLTFGFMEFVAWFTHKFIMHGFLWSLHKDHHVKRKGFFELNDFFALIFAVPSATLIILGIEAGWDFRAYMGFGIALYGIAYFFVHDILVHRRFKLFRNPPGKYARALIRAHKIHHKSLKKEDGEAFGFLFVPKKYLEKMD